MSLFSTVQDVVRSVAELPLRRSDGEFVANIPHYRRMMSFLMPGRNESVVYYDDFVKVEPLLDYIERAGAVYDTEVDITHCLVAAAGLGLHKQPRMNQFIVGNRLYHRNHSAVTFSLKRKRKDKEAKLSAVKLRFDDVNESFESICRRINEHIVIERSGEKTYSDKELNLMHALPRPVLRAAMKVVRFADDNNLLPASFIKNDPFYTGMVIANLGSLGMRAGLHHLYEYGTCSLFLMVGKVEDRPVVVDGKVTAQKLLHLRWSYDERIDDGLTSSYGMAQVRDALEQPEVYFGKLPEPAKKPRVVRG